MPHVVDVRCECGGHATFSKSVSRQVLRADFDFFRASPLFEFQKVQVHGGQRMHIARFYPGLEQCTLQTSDIPEGYSPEHWTHSRYWGNNRSRRGTFACTRCSQRKKHKLSWPDDAYYQVLVRRRCLWAFNRESAVALRDYIAATVDRTRVQKGRWTVFLHNVPGHFLHAKVRDETVKRLNKLLHA